MKNIFYREGLLPWSKNKGYNFQVYPLFTIGHDPLLQFKFELLKGTSWFYMSFCFLAGLIDFSTEWSRKRDHAGFYIQIGLFGLNLLIQTFDKRHWDDENNCWLKYKDEL